MSVSTMFPAHPSGCPSPDWQQPMRCWPETDHAGGVAHATPPIRGRFLPPSLLCSQHASIEVRCDRMKNIITLLLTISLLTSCGGDFEWLPENQPITPTPPTPAGTV